MPKSKKTLRRKSKRSTSRRGARRGGGMLSALQPAPLQPALPAGLSDALPTTDWGRWGTYSPTYAWGPTTAAPAPLANGGLYTNPQSTQPWGSSPFPATQHAWALEGAKVSGLPEVAYHQRPNDNYGESYSPRIGTPISPLHSSLSGPAGPLRGGKRRTIRR
jgi:hypothetical protein